MGGRKTEAELEEGARTLARAAMLIVVVFGIGVGGFKLVGGPDHSVVDAVYMTMITLTTVGYGETIPLEGHPLGQVFTVVLLLFGVGSFVYFFSNLTAFMVEGNLDELLWKRKMRRMIAALDNHYIVCGAGNTGVHVVKELVETERPFVLVEHDPERIKDLAEKFGRHFPAVIGDATDEEVLLEAGLAKAAGLAACIAEDKDNLLITVSAKMANPKVRIICRCIDERTIPRVKKAGADAVVSPNMIGGMRIVSEMVRPNVVTFLDIMLRDKNKGLRVEEYEIEAGSVLAGKSVGYVRGKDLADVLVVAVKRGDGSWTFNPPDSDVLDPGMALIFMGNPAGRSAVEALT